MELARDAKGRFVREPASNFPDGPQMPSKPFYAGDASSISQSFTNMPIGEHARMATGYPSIKPAPKRTTWQKFLKLIGWK